MLRITALLAAGAAALAIASSVASAAPSKGVVFDVDCGDGGTYTAIGSPGNGVYTPAFVAGGVVHPVAFSNLHGTFTGNDGTVEEFSDPDTSRNAPAGKRLLDCHFEADFSDPYGTVHFEGDAIVWVSPGK